MLSTPFDRRESLKLAAGLGLSLLVPGLSARAAKRRGPERARSLLIVWLAGGPSQLETFDPHPGHKIGGPTKAIPTTLPGLQIADLFPQTAQQIHRVSLIRSMVSKEGDHERGAYFLKTGYRPDPTVRHPSIGSIVVKEMPNPKVEIPQFISLGSGPFPPRGGYLGDALDAFRIYQPGKNVQNMRSLVGEERQDRRLAGLDVVSRAFSRGRRARVEQTLHQHTLEAALRMMNSEQLAAFDYDDEPAEIRAAYGDTQVGRGCLLARRLIEQGVRAVEVTMNGYDTHANNFDGHIQNAAELDPALATLLKDLDERDLLASTVVLCLGEFGRTPNINPLDGRDHWPTGFSCLVGGGGLKAGEVIGATDPTGKKTDPEDPIEVQDLYATVFHALGVDYEQEIITPIGRPLQYCEGRPIARLVEARGLRKS